jgi:hypothetical protein
MVPSAIVVQTFLPCTYKLSRKQQLPWVPMRLSILTNLAALHEPCRVHLVHTDKLENIWIGQISSWSLFNIEIARMLFASIALM